MLAETGAETVTVTFDVFAVIGSGETVIVDSVIPNVSSNAWADATASLLVPPGTMTTRQAS